MICSPLPVEIIISTLQTPQVMDESLNTIATVKPENSLTPDLTAEIALRRNWDDKTIYNLSQNKIELPN